MALHNRKRHSQLRLRPCGKKKQMFEAEFLPGVSVSKGGGGSIALRDAHPPSPQIMPTSVGRFRVWGSNALG